VKLRITQAALLAKCAPAGCIVLDPEVFRDVRTTFNCSTFGADNEVCLLMDRRKGTPNFIETIGRASASASPSASPSFGRRSVRALPSGGGASVSPAAAAESSRAREQRRQGQAGRKRPSLHSRLHGRHHTVAAQ